MARIKRARPSPAIIVAVLALVAALAGSAVAEEATTSAKPVTKKKAKTIANKEIDKRLPIGADELGAIEVRTAGGPVAPGTLGNFTATCAAGERIISGGVDVEPGQTTAVELEESHARGNGWQGIVFSSSAATHQVTVQALCLTQ